MKYYVFILTDSNMESLLVGKSKDIEKAIKFFTSIPNSFLKSTQRHNILVYLEELTNNEDMDSKYEKIFKLSRLEKERLINKANPDWVELIINGNITL